MPKYKLNVCNTEYGHIEVEAKNKKEAEEIVETGKELENVTWITTEVKASVIKNKYLITSNYKYEIEAESADEAVEKWHENIVEELLQQNQILENEFGESIIATEIKK